MAAPGRAGTRSLRQVQGGTPSECGARLRARRAAAIRLPASRTPSRPTSQPECGRRSTRTLSKVQRRNETQPGEAGGRTHLMDLRGSGPTLVQAGLTPYGCRQSRLQNSDRFGAAQEHPSWQRRPRTAIGAILMATMVGSALAQPPIRYFRRTSGAFGRTVFREVRPP